MIRSSGVSNQADSPIPLRPADGLPERPQEERLLQAVIDGSRSIVSIKDLHGRFIAVNRPMERLLGRSRDEIRGKTDFDVFPWDRAEYYREHDRQVIETGKPLQVEEVVDLAGGGRRLFLADKFPLVDGAGRTYGVCAIAHDVTERREAEEALRESDRRKSQFLAILSHELRNPLAPIRNSLYVLERADAGSEQARRAQAVIERQVAQMSRLVEDLLDVTRISRGKIELRTEPLELNELVRRTADDHRSAFDRSGIALEVTLCDRPLPMKGDPVRLAQVIGNLLQNAAKFTESGGRASLRVQEDPEQGAAVIRVADTGIGISPEMLPRLFEPFMQADTSLDRSRGGLGLGLALVKGLVELHGGTVAAASPGRGRGTELMVRLPRMAAACSISSQADEGSAAGALRILIVEDNVDAAESLREALALGGHRVEVAGTGLEGLERTHSFRPEVILCDIGLPGLDGYGVARAIRSDPALDPVFLVALSGYALPEDLARARAAGFDRHVAKPASLEALERLLAEVAHRRWSELNEREAGSSLAAS